MTQCDAKPGAPNTCPAGYHCAEDGYCDARCTPSGGECGDGYICTPDGRCRGEGECVGLECNIVDCTKQGKPVTTIKGTVYAPNGTLPLYGIQVYVPNAPVPPFTEGAICDRCNDELPGNPVVRTQTDEAGSFTLPNAPSGQNIPLVISSGKWRRQITIASVSECTDNTAPATDTRLPKNRTEGDIPRIALTTGSADSLECLLRRIGIDDAEIGKAGDDRRIHLYAGNGVSSFQANFAGGSGQIPSADPWWRSVDNLKPYDIVILSCEGAQNPDTKGQDGLNAMKAYADLGGRVFASHWHNFWIAGEYGGGAPTTPWRSVATWGPSQNFTSAITDVIDEQKNPKGSSFATWMLNVMGSTVRDQIPIIADTGRTTVSALDDTKAERWTYIQGSMEPQNFQFTAPITVPAAERCGKVVFSDMHVSGGPKMAGPYPDAPCGTTLTMSPQEKALAFMIFDIASCVGVLL